MGLLDRIDGQKKPVIGGGNDDAISLVKEENKVNPQVADVIDTRQFARLLQNIEDAIQFKKDELLSQERFALAQAAASIEDATSQFVKLGEQLVNVDAEELMGLMRAVQNMDEHKLAEAAMNQIAGSLEK